jgi:hypothetical protein
MGGRKDSEAFIAYKEQTIRALLIARKYFPLFFDHARLSEKAGLKCFMENSIPNFKQRFMTDITELEVARRVEDITMNALDNVRTILYDIIQAIQNDIKR